MGKQESNCPIGDKVLGPVRVVNDAAFIICKAQGQIPSSTPGSCSQLEGVRPRGAPTQGEGPSRPRLQGLMSRLSTYLALPAEPTKSVDSRDDTKMDGLGR